MSGTEANAQDRQSALERAQAVKRAHEDELMSKKNVVGVGVGLLEKSGVRTGAVGLVVMVKQKLPQTQVAPGDVIPAEIEGVPVDVQEVGTIKAQ